MPPALVGVQIGNHVLACQAKPRFGRVESEAGIKLSLVRTISSQLGNEKARIDRNAKMCRCVNPINRCLGDLATILPGMPQNLFGSRCFAQDCDDDWTRFCRFDQFDQHPLADVKIGLAGSSCQASMPLEIVLDRNIGTTQSRNFRIGNPRRITEKQQPVRLIRQQRSPVGGEKILGCKRGSLPHSCRSQSLQRRIQVRLIDVITHE